jgi:ribosome-interacting GTPase 1
VYTKPRGQIPDYSAPVIIRKSHSTVADLCNRYSPLDVVLFCVCFLLFCSIHKDILRQMKYALVWGASVKHQPQRVGKDHQLLDEDIVCK